MTCPYDPELECKSDCTASGGKTIQGCFAENLSSFQISPKATPNKRSDAAPSWHQNRNSWEKGIVRDHRGVPLLDRNGSEIGVKENEQHRRLIDERRRELATHPDPFGAKAAASKE